MSSNKTKTAVNAKKPGLSLNDCNAPISGPSKSTFSIAKLFSNAIQLANVSDATTPAQLKIEKVWRLFFYTLFTLPVFTPRIRRIINRLIFLSFFSALTLIARSLFTTVIITFLLLSLLMSRCRFCL